MPSNCSPHLRRADSLQRSKIKSISVRYFRLSLNIERDRLHESLLYTKINCPKGGLLEEKSLRITRDSLIGSTSVSCDRQRKSCQSRNSNCSMLSKRVTTAPFEAEKQEAENQILLLWTRQTHRKLRWLAGCLITGCFTSGPESQQKCDR